MKILIVEPELSIAGLLERNLTRFGYDVVIVPTPAEGLTAAHQELPDAIISAVSAPEMDGLEFCERLRGDVELSSVPIILLSDRSDTELRISAFRSGADAFMTKPVLLRELVTRLEQLLSRTSGRRTNSALTGNLSIIPLVEILQFLEVNRKTGVLRIFGQESQGETRIDRGEIRWAQLGDTLGEQAIHRMASWTSGRFEFKAKDTGVEVNVSTPTMKIILECCALVDQRQQAQTEESPDRTQL